MTVNVFELALNAQVRHRLEATFARVERGAESSDAIAAALELDSAQATPALAALEALGYVACSPLGEYSRTLLAPPAI